MTPTEVKVKLESLDLFLRATGVVDYADKTVTAAEQIILPGTLVDLGTVVEVRFISSVIDYGGQN
jgi:stage V sporulation protein D (sporulation-specific penicillin-binding protein)